MKVIDHVETRERVEELTEEKRDDYFTKLVMGKDVIEEIKTSRGDFEVKYPKAEDLINIGKLAAFRRGYKPAEAFDSNTEMLNIMVSTLDIVVVKGPEWYENAKLKNKKFTFLEVPSQEFIAELYSKAYSFRANVEQCFNEQEKSDDRPVSPKEDADEAVDGGAFGGLSSE